MSLRKYAIVYRFSDSPDPMQVSEKGAIYFHPVVGCCVEENNVPRYSKVEFPRDFMVSYTSLDAIRIYSNSFINVNREEYYHLRREARDCEERIVADFICSFILQELREHKNDKMLFIIKDSFETEKIIGRLGYLGLPLDRVRILFISWELNKLMTNFMSPYSYSIGSDMKLLCEAHNRNKLHGPYPEDDEVTMLKTYFYSFENDLYPIRISLFSQFLDKRQLNEIQAFFYNFIEERDNTELYKVKEFMYTRLPRLLMQCEDYINRNERVSDEF